MVVDVGVQVNEAITQYGPPDPEVMMGDAALLVGELIMKLDAASLTASPDSIRSRWATVLTARLTRLGPAAEHEIALARRFLAPFDRMEPVVRDKPQPPARRSDTSTVTLGYVAELRRTHQTLQGPAGKGRDRDREVVAAMLADAEAVLGEMLQ